MVTATAMSALNNVRILSVDACRFSSTQFTLSMYTCCQELEVRAGPGNEFTYTYCYSHAAMAATRGLHYLSGQQKGSGSTKYIIVQDAIVKSR